MSPQPGGRRAVTVRIDGRVQGVWFRGWMVEQARALGVDGWVRNRRDGSVEAVFCGAPPAVEGMIEACWRGPPLARVASVQWEPTEAPAENGFGHRPTE